VSVHAIAQRLSLRAPQRRSLEMLEQLSQALSLPAAGSHPSAYAAIKSGDRDAQLAACTAAASQLTAFERDFPSFTFALATGVGKTRLMGAAIAYLHEAHGLRNFFVVAPNLTIYEKLKADFTPNTRKYVFEGLTAFAATPPELITGDDWESGRGVRGGDLFGEGAVHINLFNIARFASEDGRRMRRMHEMIGQSYFDYLAELPDLALLMDESHRYRAATSAQALNDLNPLIGLEFTATPQVQQGQRATPFKNVVFDYPLANAIADGFVKRPAVAGRLNFQADTITPDQLDRIKLEDALVLHEATKAELAAYAARESRRVVKPFVLVIARDTTHAEALQAMIEGPTFHGGIYAGRVITVHSARTGAEKDEVIQRLLKVEDPDEPTEIVIHVEMLKEGWDVTNLYTIVPLRAARSQTLVEQSIGRGLRLPYGTLTGVKEIDRLTIVSHDQFRQIVEDAERPGSPFRMMEQVLIDPNDPAIRLVARTVQPNLATRFAPPPIVVTEDSTELVAPADGHADASTVQPAFQSPEEQRVAAFTYQTVGRMTALPTAQGLLGADVRAQVQARVSEALQGEQLMLGAPMAAADIARVVELVTSEVARGTIDVPRIVLQPSGETRVTYRPVDIDPAAFRYAVPAEDILIAELQSRERTRLAAAIVATEARAEDYIVRALIDAPDVDYEAQRELLYDLAARAVAAVREYASDEERLTAILVYYGRDIAEKLLVLLRANRVELPTEYVPEVRAGWTPLNGQDRTYAMDEEVRPFRAPVVQAYRIRYFRFGGFRRCLFPEQQFHSEGERKFAVLLEDESDAELKWFRPGLRDIRIFWSSDHAYLPDFVVETATERLLVEIKGEGEMDDDEVRAKARAAVRWCEHASAHGTAHGGKPWRYLLVPDVEAHSGNDLAGLIGRFTGTLPQR
jgi:type III restriction enzyme